MVSLQSIQRSATLTSASARSIGDAIARWAGPAGHTPALVSCDAGDIAYSRLHATISSVAAQLARAGLRREDRVGLVVPAGTAGAQLVVALACNVTLVPINPALTGQEAVEVAHVSRLDAMVIPTWLQTPARASIRDAGLMSFDAVLGADGTLSLDLLTPAKPERADIRTASASDVALLLRSSGTTGAPKLIPVTHGNLLAMAEKLGSTLWFNLSAQDRAACTLPLYYAAGLKTSLFVPLILGGSAAFPPPAQALDIAQWLGALKPTYLSVAPAGLNAMVDRLKARGPGFEPGSLRFVMCAAAYLPEALRLAAQAALRVPVLEFYGLSEAGVMAANPAPPGRAKPGTVGVPAPGELMVVDDDWRPMAPGMAGQIVISGPTVTPGYVTGNSGPSGLEGGWLRTGDLGRVDADGYLTIAGRLKEVINRGGEKVFPYEIEKAMLQHPAVAEAAAFGVPHPRLGESVAAAVVLKTGSTCPEDELKAFLADRLAGFKLPRRLHFVPALPRGSTGKVLRGALSESYASARPELVPPDRLLEWELRNIWERLLGTRDIGIDDDFFEKGGDSLLATDMLVEVERLTGNPYPASELSTLTIRRMADVVAAGLGAQRDLITLVKDGPGIPLLFCHGDYVGRGTYARKLAALLPDDRPVFLLDCYADLLAGRRLEEVADDFLKALSPAADSPVILGGYCNGGLMAWQLAHQLRSRGVEVAHLLLVETLSLNARPALRALSTLFNTGGAAGAGRRQALMRKTWAVARRLGNLPYAAARGRIGPGLLRKAGPEPRRDEYTEADRSVLEMMTRFVPPRLDVDVTCFIAEDGRPFDTRAQSWRQLAASVREVRIPGSHHTALVEGRAALAAAIQETLQRVATRRLAPAADERQARDDSLGRAADASA